LFSFISVQPKPFGPSRLAAQPDMILFTYYVEPAHSSLSGLVRPTPFIPFLPTSGSAIAGWNAPRATAHYLAALLHHVEESLPTWTPPLRAWKPEHSSRRFLSCSRPPFKPATATAHRFSSPTLGQPPPALYKAPYSTSFAPRFHHHPYLISSAPQSSCLRPSPAAASILYRRAKFHRPVVFRRHSELPPVALSLLAWPRLENDPRSTARGQLRGVLLQHRRGHCSVHGGPPCSWSTNFVDPVYRFSLIKTILKFL
jgi:hypothetical protein